MGLSRTVSEINGDFIRKSQIFPTLYTRIFCASAERVPFGIEYRRWEFKKTRMIELLGRKRSLTVSSAVWILYTNLTDGQTDGRTPDDSKDRAYA